MSMICNQTPYDKLLAGRPIRSWRVQPYTITDGTEHTAVPVVAGYNHIITDVILTARSSTLTTVNISGSGGVELLTLEVQYESRAVSLRTHIIVPQNEAIVVQRIAGAQPVTITIIGYSDAADVEQTVYTVT